MNASDLKASNLEQALCFFNPTKPLSDVGLRLWYVPRSRSPRGRMRTLLEKETEAQRILFVGHRGSGKSTELNKLAEELEPSFHTIEMNLIDITGRTTPEYDDLMLAMSTRVTRYCIEKKLIRRPLGEALGERWQDLLDWWQQLAGSAQLPTVATEENLSVKLNTILGQLELGVKQSSQTRDRVKLRLNQQMPELIERLNWVIEQAESGGRPLLIIVEGLDKVDLESANNIFRDHSPTITTPRAAMVFTFPLALRHSDHFNTIRLSFPEVFYLPNICPRKVDASEDQDGLAALRRLVLARIEERLIMPEALELILRNNGGVPVWLVALIRGAILYALERGGDRIAIGDAENAVRDLLRETLPPLSREDHRVLRARHQDRLLSNDSMEQRLLYNGSLIEYANAVPWCDAHPVLWPLLEDGEHGRQE